MDNSDKYEILDRLTTVEVIIDNILLNHPVITSDHDLLEQVENMKILMGKLYEQISANL